MNLLRDSVALQVSALGRAAAGLVSIAWLSHALGARAQGEYLTAVAAFSVLYLVGSAGFASLAVARIAEHRDDARQVARWIAFLSGAGTALALAIGAIGLLLRPWLPGWLAVRPEIGAWFALLCWTPLLELPRSVAVAALQGTRRMRSLALLELVSEWLRVFAVVLGASRRGDPLDCIVGWLLASALSGALSLLVLRRARASGAPIPATAALARGCLTIPGLADVRSAISIGLMRNSTAVAREALPALITARLAGAEWVAFLRIGQRVAGAATLFGAGVARSSLPAMGEVVRDAHALRRVWRRASLAGGASVAVALGAILLALPLVLEHALRDDYRAPVLHVTRLLAPAVLLSGLLVATDAFHVVTRTQRVGLRIALGGIVWATLVLVVAVGRDPRYGAAWGMSVASLWGLWHLAFAWRWTGQAALLQGDTNPRSDAVR